MHHDGKNYWCIPSKKTVGSDHNKALIVFCRSQFEKGEGRFFLSKVGQRKCQTNDDEENVDGSKVLSSVKIFISYLETPANGQAEIILTGL